MKIGLGAATRKDAEPAGQVRSGPVTAPALQHLDGLTIRKISMLSDGGFAGGWYIWERDGRQVHASPAASKRVFVAERFYDLGTDGGWRRAT